MAVIAHAATRIPPATAGAGPPTRGPPHAAHLIVHGYLHLEGFDHQSDDDAEVMEQREIEALARLGVADPYAEGAPAPDDGAAHV